jgi:hypothetical protein
VPLYNFFGSSSTTSGCNLVDNIGSIEEQYSIDGRRSVEISYDHNYQDEQDDGDLYYSTKKKQERITLSSRILRSMNLKMRKFGDAILHCWLPDELRDIIP